MKTRLILSVLTITLMAIALFHLSNPLRVGKSIENEGMLSAFMREQGYVPMGSWGDETWPAFILKVESGSNGIEFSTSAGQPTAYTDPEYAGYVFKLIRLKGKNDQAFDRLFKTSDKK